MAEPLPGISGLRQGETPLVPAGESLRLRVAPKVGAAILDSCRRIDEQSSAMACVVAPASGNALARRALAPSTPAREEPTREEPRAAAEAPAHSSQPIAVTGAHAGAPPMLNGTVLDSTNVGPVSQFFLGRGGNREVMLVRPEDAERDLTASFAADQAQYTRLETVREKFNAIARHRGQPEFSRQDWYALLARSRIALEGDSPQLLNGMRVYTELTQAELFAVFEHAVREAVRRNPQQFGDPERAIEFGRSILASNVGEELQRANPGHTVTAEQVARHISRTARELTDARDHGQVPPSMARMPLPTEQEVHAFVKRQQKAGIIRFDGRSSFTTGAELQGELIAGPRLVQTVAGERERRLGEARIEQARAQFTRALNLEQLRSDAVVAAYERVVLRRREVVTAERDLESRDAGAPRRFRLPSYM